MDGLRWERVPVEAPKHAPPAGPDGFCWSTPKGWMVGSGIVAECSARGPRRFSELRLSGSLRWVGGFAFENHAEGTWRAFGAARFVAPRMLLVVEGEEAYLQLAWRKGDASPVDDAMAWLGRGSPNAVGRVDVVEREAPSVHQARVRAGIDRLHSGSLRKVVISRDTILRGGFDPQSLWSSLLGEKGEHARFGLFVDGSGLVGQTPETLVRREGEWLHSEALAGSASLDRASALLRSAKDRAEHARVVEAVADALSELGELEAPPQPVVRRLRAIAHLWTPIRARSSASLLEAAARLHPTPATGGVPRSEALPLLRRLEGRDRGWYCGAVGWMDGEGQGDLRVALRSVLVGPRELRLFVGGGIMADSDPEQEWAETMLKEQAILDAFGLKLP
ncbi:MAG: isochorismate synthase [Myxococcota bacterium]